MVDKANADDHLWQRSVNTAGPKTRPTPILKEEEEDEVAEAGLLSQIPWAT